MLWSDTKTVEIKEIRQCLGSNSPAIAQATTTYTFNAFCCVGELVFRSVRELTYVLLFGLVSFGGKILRTKFKENYESILKNSEYNISWNTSADFVKVNCTKVRYMQCRTNGGGPLERLPWAQKFMGRHFHKKKFDFLVFILD